MTNIYFDKELLEHLKSQVTIFWKMAWVYRSNWRVLHIDGFEGGRKLPLNSGVARQFFQYAEAV